MDNNIIMIKTKLNGEPVKINLLYRKLVNDKIECRWVDYHFLIAKICPGIVVRFDFL